MKKNWTPNELEIRISGQIYIVSKPLDEYVTSLPSVLSPLGIKNETGWARANEIYTGKTSSGLLRRPIIIELARLEQSDQTSLMWKCVFCTDCANLSTWLTSSHCIVKVNHAWYNTREPAIHSSYGVRWKQLIRKKPKKKNFFHKHEESLHVGQRQGREKEKRNFCVRVHLSNEDDHHRRSGAEKWSGKWKESTSMWWCASLFWNLRWAIVTHNLMKEKREKISLSTVVMSE
jgi:hypothetical protein